MKNWVIFLPWELDFEMKCEIFKKYTFKFWPKNVGKLRFLLEFWVIFLSFRFLEFLCPWVFLRGAQKKACCKSKPHVLVSWPIKWARRLKNPLFKWYFCRQMALGEYSTLKIWLMFCGWKSAPTLLRSPSIQNWGMWTTWSLPHANQSVT